MKVESFPLVPECAVCSMVQFGQKTLSPFLGAILDVFHAPEGRKKSHLISPTWNSLSLYETCNMEAIEPISYLALTSC